MLVAEKRVSRFEDGTDCICLLQLPSSTISSDLAYFPLSFITHYYHCTLYTGPVHFLAPRAHRPLHPLLQTGNTRLLASKQSKAKGERKRAKREYQNIGKYPTWLLNIPRINDITLARRPPSTSTRKHTTISLQTVLQRT